MLIFLRLLKRSPHRRPCMSSHNYWSGQTWRSYRETPRPPRSMLVEVIAKPPAPLGQCWLSMPVVAGLLNTDGEGARGRERGGGSAGEERGGGGAGEVSR